MAVHPKTTPGNVQHDNRRDDQTYDSEENFEYQTPTIARCLGVRLVQNLKLLPLFALPVRSQTPRLEHRQRRGGEQHHQSSPGVGRELDSHSA